MEEDLDHILLDQYHAALRQRKLIAKLKKLMKNDHQIDMVSVTLEKRIQFYVTMIKDKTILGKKVKRKKSSEDVLCKNPVFEMYRYGVFVTFFGYQMFWNSMKDYMNQFNKKQS
jgi:hypothetical protein